MAAPRASPPATAAGAPHPQPHPRQRASAWFGMATAASVISAADATAIFFAVMITASVLAGVESVALTTSGSVDLGQWSQQRESGRWRPGYRAVRFLFKSGFDCFRYVGTLASLGVGDEAARFYQGRYRFRDRVAALGASPTAGCGP